LRRKRGCTGTATTQQRSTCRCSTWSNLTAPGR